MAERMPALFFGHGNPMNALLVNSYTKRWAEIGETLPRPKAILSISAHWFIEDAAVTVSTAPRTIHDFGGFPRELYRVQYSAPGDPHLAARVQQLLAPVPVRRDDGWGLDHGTWSVLRHIYPQADIPVVQLSIDETQAPSFHYEIGERLAPLREEGVLIFGSGNVVHNLHAYAWGQHVVAPYDWANSFEVRVRELLLAENYAPLIHYETKLGREAELAVPTPDHYLPLLYIAGTRAPSEPLAFPVEGVDGGSVSMLAVRIG
ncbi:MAG TPA: 4,5-DOPA dioxygenase extradiol [Candidatus Acidoferrales bacterium]|nr:4,5-DOPA dioxygenase extradiol [Candidatus Acidoferrales bacterium]